MTNYLEYMAKNLLILTRRDLVWPPRQNQVAMCHNRTLSWKSISTTDNPNCSKRPLLVISWLPLSANIIFWSSWQLHLERISKRRLKINSSKSQSTSSFHLPKLWSLLKRFPIGILCSICLCTYGLLVHRFFEPIFYE